MQRLLRKIIPVLLLAALLLVAFIIKSNPPKNERRAPPSGPQMVVETLTVTSGSYPMRLQSYGTVQPRTQTTLVAQVGGEIISVNPSFRDGGFFEKGEVLLRLDPRDYQANVSIAEATVMDARQALAEAQARTNQADEDWQRLGNAGDAPPLVRRLPQLEAARARVASAESNLQKAKLDLERSRIVAPFAGRILNQFVDLGRVVPVNTQLAEIYAIDSIEIRLPLKNRDLQFIELPEIYRGNEDNNQDAAEVTIISELGGRAEWEATLVRTEGAIDTTARQLHVIAQIDDPFGQQHAGKPPLKIGQYVTAAFDGLVLEDVLVIPNSAIYQGSFAYIVEDGVLQRRALEVAWQNEVDAVVATGLTAGDELVITPLGQVTSGTRVAIAGAAPSSEQAGVRP